MNILLAPRKKAFSREEPKTAHTHKARSLHHKLENSVFSYVFWFQELSELCAEDPRLAKCVVSDLLPLKDDDLYAEKLQLACQACMDEAENNAYLIDIMRQSMDFSVTQTIPPCSACETVEAVKRHFDAMMDPLRLLLFERAFTFERRKLIEYFTGLDAMTQVYYHVFRKHASKDLQVLWIMTSLTNDLLRNKDIIQEIQLNWTNLHANPNAVRQIINVRLCHRRFKHPGLSSG